MFKHTPVLFVAATAFLLVSCDNSISPTTQNGTDIPGTLASNGDFQLVAEAFSSTGLDATLVGAGPFTIFAPTDLTFEFLGAETVERLFDEDYRDLLTRILKFHIVPGQIQFEDLADGLELQTLDGLVLDVEVSEEELRVGGALITEQNIEADNGLIHGLSDVLRSNLETADRLRLTPILTRFVDLATSTGAIAELKSFDQVTVFAPIDGAFPPVGSPEFNQYVSPSNTDILKRVIDFHIAPGLHHVELLEHGATITTTDGIDLTLMLEDGVRSIDGRPVISDPVETADGVIYLINGLLTDSLNVDQQLRLVPTTTTYATNVAGYADLVSQLSGADEYTVFAPVDASYTALGQDVLDALDAPENAALAERLTRVHVVPGRYEAEDLTNGLVLEAIEETLLAISVGQGQTFVRDRKITAFDIPAENGVVHLIDELIHPDFGFLDNLLLEGFTRQLELIRREGLEPMFRAPGPFTMFAFANPVFRTRLEGQKGGPTLEDREDLQDIFLFHSAEGVVPREDGEQFQSLEGSSRIIERGFDGPNLVYRLDGYELITTHNLGDYGQLYEVDVFCTPSGPFC